IFLGAWWNQINEATQLPHRVAIHRPMALDADGQFFRQDASHHLKDLLGIVARNTFDNIVAVHFPFLPQALQEWLFKLVASAYRSSCRIAAYALLPLAPVRYLLFHVTFHIKLPVSLSVYCFA